MVKFIFSPGFGQLSVWSGWVVYWGGTQLNCPMGSSHTGTSWNILIPFVWDGIVAVTLQRSAGVENIGPQRRHAQ